MKAASNLDQWTHDKPIGVTFKPPGTTPGDIFALEAITYFYDGGRLVKISSAISKFRTIGRYPEPEYSRFIRAAKLVTFFKEQVVPEGRLDEALHLLKNKEFEPKVGLTEHTVEITKETILTDDKALELHRIFDPAGYFDFEEGKLMRADRGHVAAREHRAAVRAAAAPAPAGGRRTRRRRRRRAKRSRRR
jgi:hypothetical protein